MESDELQCKWPVMLVDNIESTAEHYLDVLGFHLVDEIDFDGKVREVLLALAEFQLILHNRWVENAVLTGVMDPWAQTGHGRSVLCVSVRDAVLLGRELMLRGGKPLTGLLYGVDIRDGEGEGFYYRDPEGQVLFFVTYDGPYSSHDWEWGYPFPDPARVEENQKTRQWPV